MLQVNLLPWRRVRRQRRMRFWLSISVCLPAVLLASGLIGAVFITQELTLLRQHFSALTLSAQTFSLQQQRVDNASQQVKVLMEKRLISQQNAQLSRDYLQMLALLAEKIPQDVWLSELVEHQHQLTLTGEGRFYSDILTLRETLATSDFFSDVSLSDVRQQSNQALSFALKMQLRALRVPLSLIEPGRLP